MAEDKAKKPIQQVQGKPSYGAKDIFVLEGLDPVRKRPGMYIGSTGVDGLHHLVWEVVNNSIDEAMAGYAKNIHIELLPNNVVAIQDDGRGIPVEIHAQTGVSALETVLTKLHAGGKFGGESYKVSGGLHGVGVSVVNALSTECIVQVSRDGSLYEQSYARGVPKFKTKKIGTSTKAPFYGKTGTRVSFTADNTIFPVIEYDWNHILHYIRQQAYLTKGISIELADTRIMDAPSYYAFYFDGGLKSFVKSLTDEPSPLQSEQFYVEKSVGPIHVEVACTYTNTLDTKELSFANNIHTVEGGTHVTGFRSAITRVINDCARAKNAIKTVDDNLTGDDVRDGLVSVISVKLPEPQFEGQTKTKLGTTEARAAVETVVAEAFKDFLERNDDDARKIVARCLLIAKARKAAKAAKDTVLRKGVLEGLTLPGKLADCSSKHPAESELFIVEGDSAGGCFSANTKVALTDGRSVSFKDLIKEAKQGKQNYCYTILPNRSVGIEKITNPRITKKNAPVMKVTLDNGEEIICTPNHRFMLANGSYKEARLLACDDSLMPLYRKYSKIGGRITIDGYEMIFDASSRGWIFTHMLTDLYNLENNAYQITDGSHRHHKDFNKLNNNPDNLIRISKEEHLVIHRAHAKKTLGRPDVMEKLRLLRRTPAYRKKISDAMRAPAMQAVLSERAKKQWEDGRYKAFMAEKFIAFYNANSAYRKKNNDLLKKNQQEYWSIPKNRELQSVRTAEYLKNHPKAIELLAQKAHIQWNNKELLAWRSTVTKAQWTDDFRKQRKEAYDRTYCEKALSALRKIYEKTGLVDQSAYVAVRKETNDKTLLRYETILERFFGNDKEKMEEAVRHYNHKVVSITMLKKRINVYDIEVPHTHNFALASGIFVHNSAKMGRDRRTQAILPLRGKILNVEKARMDKIIAFQEIKFLVIALGTAIAESFDLAKLRYHKIVIMTDADVDGAHIRTLLLTLFYRHFEPLIAGGYIYIAQPPLYKIHKGKTVQYAYDDAGKDKILKNLPEASVQRYKGLGEMNPEQLWETTMDPANRILQQVTVADAEDANRLFDILMGSEVEPRKHFIQTHALSVKNIDT